MFDLLYSFEGNLVFPQPYSVKGAHVSVKVTVEPQLNGVGGMVTQE